MMMARRRGAMGGSMQGRRERAGWISPGATEDAAAGRPARPGDTDLHRVGASGARPLRWAYDAASVRLAQPVLRRMLRMWFAAVCSLITSVLPISRLLSPRATRP